MGCWYYDKPPRSPFGWWQTASAAENYLLQGQPPSQDSATHEWWMEDKPWPRHFHIILKGHTSSGIPHRLAKFGYSAASFFGHSCYPLLCSMVLISKALSYKNLACETVSESVHRRTQSIAGRMRIKPQICFASKPILLITVLHIVNVL